MNPAEDTTKKQEVIDYYSRLGSRLGYRLVMKKSQHFGVYDNTHTTETLAQENFSAQFMKLLNVHAGMKILDAGCGQGVLAVDIARHEDVHVTGVTIVPLEVKKSLKLAKRAGVSSQTDFIEGDYHQLPFPDNSFDRVYAVETLSHAYDLKLALKELHRVLRPGGVFIAAEYEFDFDNPQYAAFTKELAGYVENYASIHAIREFRKGNFIHLLKGTKFVSLQEHDWTKRLMKSFQRIRTIGRPYKKLIMLLGKESAHPNVVASSFYADGAETGVFRYKVYEARKDER